MIKCWEIQNKGTKSCRRLFKFRQTGEIAQHTPLTSKVTQFKANIALGPETSYYGLLYEAVEDEGPNMKKNSAAKPKN